MTELGVGRHAHALTLSFIMHMQTHFLAQWAELAELYLRVGEPRLAAFCYEELVLFGPANFAYHTALAEVYYSLGSGSGGESQGKAQGKAKGGGEDSLRLARKHYAQALELLQQGAGSSSTSSSAGGGEEAAGAAAGLRALYGMCAVSQPASR